MAEAKKKSVFETLNAINVNEHTEQKNGLTYLSWAWAWAEVKKCYPEANYTIYEREDGINYFTDGKTCWVKTGVTIEGLEHIEYLPVMDYKNKSIPLNNVTSFEVNKAIQRSLTKALARHGLGLYIYAGEDLPEANDGNNQVEEVNKPVKKVAPKVEQKEEVKAATPNKDRFVYLCNLIGFTKEEKIQTCTVYGLNKNSKDEDFALPVKNMEEEFEDRIKMLEAKGE